MSYEREEYMEKRRKMKRRNKPKMKKIGGGCSPNQSVEKLYNHFKSAPVYKKNAS